jgi:RNA polymerase sigma-70 factor (ECF subfamily)
MAHNWISDYYRREPIHAELQEDERSPLEGPEETTKLRQRQENLRKALQVLTPDQQQVIVLKYMHGWKNKDIARSLDKSLEAVKSMHLRALAALQRLLNFEDVV